MQRTDVRPLMQWVIFSRNTPIIIYSMRGYSGLGPAVPLRTMIGRLVGASGIPDPTRSYI